MSFTLNKDLTAEQVRATLDAARLSAWQRAWLLAREERKGVNMRLVYGCNTATFVAGTAADLDHALVRWERANKD